MACSSVLPLSRFYRTAKACKAAPLTERKWSSMLCRYASTLVLAIAATEATGAGLHGSLAQTEGAASPVPMVTAHDRADPGSRVARSALRSNHNPAHLSMPLSQDARAVLHWVHKSGNNAQLPFVLVDKLRAEVHVFDAAGVLQASSAVLLGLARGDHSVPGIGERPISQIAPHERTTPAGRFVSEPGHNLKGEDIVWIDYDDAVSLHRVRPSNNPAERRAQRLASRTAADNRISFGCVNLPPSFYDRFIAPGLGKQAGVIYVLPETQPVAEFFGFNHSVVQH